MKLKFTTICGITCLAATVSIALGQAGASICFIYGQLGTDQPPLLQPNQPSNGCTAYVVCPTGFRCLTGSKDKKVSNPFTKAHSCQYYIAGSGTPPNCFGGTPTAVPGGGPQATVTVTDQTCTGDCMEAPPA